MGRARWEWWWEGGFVACASCCGGIWATVGEGSVRFLPRDASGEFTMMEVVGDCQSFNCKHNCLTRLRSAMTVLERKWCEVLVTSKE
jgi:hypothetical protein